MKLSPLFLTLLLFSSTAFAQTTDSSASQPDTTVTSLTVMPKDSPSRTDSLTTEQLLIQMQKQMADLQLKIDEIQSAVTRQKDIVPTSQTSNSHFYFGFHFAFYLTKDQYAVSSDTKQSLGTKFSFAVRPHVGYVFSPRWNAGLKFVYADCQFSDSTATNFSKILSTAFSGYAYPFNYITWNVQPYVRFKVTKFIWNKVNLWAELSGYVGQMIPRDGQTRELLTSQRSVVYGIALRPMLTLDLNKNLMIYSSMDFLSWNGAKSLSDEVSGFNNNISFQFIPIQTLLSGLFNIGLIRKF